MAGSAIFTKHEQQQFNNILEMAFRNNLLDRNMKRTDRNTRADFRATIRSLSAYCPVGRHWRHVLCRGVLKVRSV
jgi:hypothetical protein